jgi:hypothetical protein
MEGDAIRLERLAVQAEERWRRLQDDIDQLRRDIVELEREVLGPPRKESVRGRLHDLENDAAAARVAADTLAVIQMRQERESGRRLGVLEWLIGSVLVVVGPVAAALILRAFGV